MTNQIFLNKYDIGKSNLSALFFSCNELRWRPHLVSISKIVFWKEPLQLRKPVSLFNHQEEFSKDFIDQKARRKRCTKSLNPIFRCATPSTGQIEKEKLAIWASDFFHLVSFSCYLSFFISFFVRQKRTFLPKSFHVSYLQDSIFLVIPFSYALNIMQWRQHFPEWGSSAYCTHPLMAWHSTPAHAEMFLRHSGQHWPFFLLW